MIINHSSQSIANGVSMIVIKSVVINEFENTKKKLQTPEKFYNISAQRKMRKMRKKQNQFGMMLYDFV